MRQTSRDKSTEKVVGIDVFVDSDLLPAQLADGLSKIIDGSNFKLTMISNRGTQVWPSGSIFTECVNFYRCRFEIVQGKTMSDSELFKMVAKVADKYRVCATDALLNVGEKRGYSLAQGQ